MRFGGFVEQKIDDLAEFRAHRVVVVTRAVGLHAARDAQRYAARLGPFVSAQNHVGCQPGAHAGEAGFDVVADQQTRADVMQGRARGAEEQFDTVSRAADFDDRLTGARG
ncbi:MAG TPA: hypothetical protein VGT98_05750, partial [Candidatus Elarobacter sp.]|nr:hypothetical protein [Candidatus Elarobacter sp.]